MVLTNELSGRFHSPGRRATASVGRLRTGAHPILGRLFGPTPTQSRTIDLKLRLERAIRDARPSESKASVHAKLRLAQAIRTLHK
ncbi:MAG: hypothetical protein HOP29_10420 [Phycisphaerales bacterium]|nr:hypothetical protein [Phycisphaerales bacterium]